MRVALAVRCGQSVGRACVWACGSARAGLSAVAVRPAAAVCNCRTITMFYLPAEFSQLLCFFLPLVFFVVPAIHAFATAMAHGDRKLGRLVVKSGIVNFVISRFSQIVAICLSVINVRVKVL